MIPVLFLPMRLAQLLWVTVWICLAIDWLRENTRTLQSPQTTTASTYGSTPNSSTLSTIRLVLPDGWMLQRLEYPLLLFLQISKGSLLKSPTWAMYPWSQLYVRTFSPVERQLLYLSTQKVAFLKEQVLQSSCRLSLPSPRINKIITIILLYNFEQLCPELILGITPPSLIQYQSPGYSLQEHQELIIQSNIIQKMRSKLRAGCKQLVLLLLYLMVQTLVAFTVLVLQLNLLLHLSLIFTASTAYFLVALKNPGYLPGNHVKGEIDRSRTLPEASEPFGNLRNLDNLVSKNQEVHIDLELRIQSNLKSENEKDKWSQQSEQLGSAGQDWVVEGEQRREVVQAEPTQMEAAVPAALKAVKRHCKLCNISQGLRTRHCKDCGRCVSTFDHHCPWLDNCIGEGNKMFLLLFLLLQQIQLFVLGGELTIKFSQEGSLSILPMTIGSLLLGGLLFGILCFQLSMISRNLTTWQHLRWNSIEYLRIFSKEDLVSLFDRGYKANISAFLRSSCQSQPVRWERELNPKAGNCLVKPCSSTQRRLSRTIHD